MDLYVNAMDHIADVTHKLSGEGIVLIIVLVILYVMVIQIAQDVYQTVLHNKLLAVIVNA